MPVTTISSKVDPRDGFTLHEIDIHQWLNSQNIERTREGRPPIVCEAMSSVRLPDSISTMIIYR